jgi:integrase
VYELSSFVRLLVKHVRYKSALWHTEIKFKKEEEEDMTQRSNASKKFPFTKKALEALPPHDPNSPSREAEYSDQECTGLRLRVSKGAGKKYFQYRYTFLSRKYCISIGEFPAISVQDARQIAAEYKLMIARGNNPATQKNKARTEETFEQFCKYYLDYARQQKKTWQDDKYKIDKRLIPALGKFRLSAITTKDIAMLNTKELERTSVCTANHLFSTLRSMMNFAVKLGLIEKNPCAGLSKFREGPLRERYLSREELPRFLRALAKEDDTLSKAAILLLLFTGCRKNEILSLQWSQIRLDEGRFLLPVTKNGRSRSVILNQRASEILQELASRKGEADRTSKSNYVFPSRHDTKKKYLYDLRKPLQKACTLAGIENFRTHDLRHTFASIAVSSGADLYAVQRLLGHTDISMTQRYSHLSAYDLQTATQGVAALMDRLAA